MEVKDFIEGSSFLDYGVSLFLISTNLNIDGLGEWWVLTYGNLLLLFFFSRSCLNRSCFFFSFSIKSLISVSISSSSTYISTLSVSLFFVQNVFYDFLGLSSLAFLHVVGCFKSCYPILMGEGDAFFLRESFLISTIFSFIGLLNSSSSRLFSSSQLILSSGTTYMELDWASDEAALNSSFVWSATKSFVTSKMFFG